MTNPTRRSVLFPSRFAKPLHISFDSPEASSDGGAVLLKAVDANNIGLPQALAAALRDETGRHQGQTQPGRDPGLLGWRGYSDANEAGRMSSDAIGYGSAPVAANRPGSRAAR